MGEKLVTELAGIGPVLGERLTEKGFDKAYTVLGQFLLLKMKKCLWNGLKTHVQLTRSRDQIVTIV